MNAIPSLISLSRICATIGIFAFHYLGLAGFRNDGIDYLSIIVFCFITGFLAYNEKHPVKWFVKRVYSIMIPYWLVIIPVVLINWIVNYKKTSLLSDLITILGGNLFLDDPVYVIAWYITFVNILYFLAFIDKLISPVILKRLFWALLGVFFVFFTMKATYFFSFAVGYWLSNKTGFHKHRVVLTSKTASTLFRVQDRCYAFFLIHGGVLIYLFKIVRFEGGYAFGAGVIISVLGAAVLYKISAKIIETAFNRTIETAR